jgi:hypothetical protein
MRRAGRCMSCRPSCRRLCSRRPCVRPRLRTLAMGCRGVSRSDFRYDDVKDDLVLLEVNTQPGMTPTSLAPEQAAHTGMSYDDLVRWMVEDASCPR